MHIIRNRQLGSHKANGEVRLAHHPLPLFALSLYFYWKNGLGSSRFPSWCPKESFTDSALLSSDGRPLAHEQLWPNDQQCLYSKVPTNNL